LYVGVELSFNHQWDVLWSVHVVWIRREALLACRLGHHLADRLKKSVTCVDLHIQGIGQEVVDLLKDLAWRDLWWGWIPQDHVNLLKCVGLVVRDASPVVRERFLRHLNLVDIPVHVDRQSDRLVHLIALRRYLKHYVERRQLITRLVHHGHHDCLRWLPVLISNWGALDCQFVLVEVLQA